MKHKIEFIVKIQVETDFKVSKKAFLEVPIFSLKVYDMNETGFFDSIYPVKFLSCKMIEKKFLD